ncbi:MAG: TIGR01212 family radical SAM protein [Planctomycetota bacterium]|nr:MAG: TIGR01212 family radical SAM protein [Planctomycetota bacterium]
MYKFPENKRYRILRPWLEEKFGGRTWKVGLDAGLSCPHIKDNVGCVFCDPPSYTPAARNEERLIYKQLIAGISGVKKAHRFADRFIAYFQSGTNTFGNINYLREVFSQSLNHPDVVCLSIGTRPDCISNKMLDMISEVAGDKHVIIEYGLQSINEERAKWMNRGHDLECFNKAVLKTAAYGFDVVTHVMVGFQDESKKDMIELAKFCGDLPINGIKIHNLHVTINTPLAEWYFNGEYKLISQEEYIGLVCDIIEHLPKEMAIHRVSASSPRPYLVAPEWCRSSPANSQLIDNELLRRDTWQGKHKNNNIFEESRLNKC